MLSLAVFVSGRGSNLDAILNSIENGVINAEVKAVVSNKLNCPAIDKAKDLDIPYFFVSGTDSDKFIEYNELIDEFTKLNIQLIVLAGFLKKIPASFTDFYHNKIINIHPALLPSFGGKGMYGMNVHKAVFDISAQVSGPTVHFVNSNYDEGKIIAQKPVDISKAESPEDIAALVLKEEHKLLPFVIKKFAENKILIKHNRVYIED